MSVLVLNANTASPITVTCQRAGKGVPRRVGSKTYSFAGAERSSVRGQAKVIPITTSYVDTATEALIQNAGYNGAALPCSGDILGNIQTVCSFENVVSNMMPGLPGFFEMSFTLNEVQPSNVLLRYAPGDTITGESFSRATTATYYDVNGVVQTAAINAKRDAHYLNGVRSTLLEGPETEILIRTSEFDNAAWTKGGVTITANAVAGPDGTVTADFMKEDASTGDHRAFQAITPANAQGYGGDVFVKQAVGTRLVMLTAVVANGELNPGVIFDLAQGIVVYGIGGIRALGSGWFRIWSGLVGTGGATNFQVRLVQSIGTGTGPVTTYAGDNTSGIYVWGGNFKANGHALYPYNIATEGDSISVSTRWPAFLGMPGYATMTVNAVAGTTTVDMRTRYDIYKTGGQTHFIGLMGINDIRLDVPIATTQANLAYMWSDARARGMIVVIMTTTPFHGDGTTWTTTRNATQLVLNDWIRAYAATNNFLLIDTYALMGDPTNTTYLLPAYDSGDGIHPTAAGSNAIANAVRQKVLFFSPEASSYIPAVAATVLRQTDGYNLPFAYPPGEITIYVQLVELGTLVAAGELIAISSGSASPVFEVFGITGFYKASHNNGVATVSAILAAAPHSGQINEVLARLFGDGSVDEVQSIAGAASLAAAQSVANALANAFSGQLVWINSYGGSTIGFVAIRSVKIVAGIRSLAEMRAA